MKYGIRNGSLNITEWKDALVMAGEIGFDGVELTVNSEEEIDRLLTPSGRDEVLAWCKRGQRWRLGGSYALFGG